MRFDIQDHGLFSQSKRSAPESECNTEGKRSRPVDWAGRQVEVIRALDEVVNFQHVEDDFQTCLWTGTPEEIEAVLQSGPWANYLFTKGNLAGRSLLTAACEHGYVEDVMLLVKYGADVNMPDSKGITPLEQARKVGSKEICTFLKQQGAGRPCYKEVDNSSKRIRFGKCSVESVCALDECPEIEIQNKIRGIVCRLHNESVEDLESYLQTGPWVNQHIQTRLHNGRSYISLACQHGNYRAVKTLIEYGASVTEKDSSRLTPLEHAQRRRDSNIIELLLQNMRTLRQ